MNGKFQKIISALLALSVIFTLGACEKKQNGTNPFYNPDAKVGDTGGLRLPITDKTNEIHWSITSDVNTMDLNDSYVAKKLREMTGVNVRLDVYPVSVAPEKIRILAAAKDLPNIIGQGLEPEFADDLSMQGAFAAVEDYIDVLPNFKRIFVDNKDNNWIFKSYAAPDGKLYGFYGWDYNREVNTGVTMYRKDIFDKNGLELWDSPETFYRTLKRLKEIYPNSTPYTIKSGELIFEIWSRSWGMRESYLYYDEADKTWKFTDIQPKYKEMLDFMRKLYADGLIDPEFLTNTQASWTSKMTQADKAFVTTDWIGRMEMFKDQTKNTVPDYDLRFARPIGPNQTVPKVSQLCWARYVRNDEDAETSFKLLDFVLSPTGRELISMGVEGETYTLGEDGMAIMKGFEDKPNVGSNELAEKWGMMLEGMYLGFDRRSSNFNFSEREQEAQDYAKDPKHLDPIDPIPALTSEEKEEYNSIISELQKACKEFSTKYVLGTETGDEAWNNWVQKAKKLGCDKIAEIYNSAQKRFDSN